MTDQSHRKQGVFITGTDTNVGKTVVSSILVSALQNAMFQAGYFKPVQTGTDLDCDTVRHLSAVPDEWVERPVYAFPEPISPNRAALIHQTKLSLDQIQGRWKGLSKRTWVVEGSGGLLVPLNEHASIRDLISALGLPMIVVASTRLGTINHILLTIESASRAGLTILGIILVGDEDPGLAGLLCELTDVPVLAQIQLLSSLSAEAIQELARHKFPAHKLQEWFRNG